MKLSPSTLLSAAIVGGATLASLVSAADAPSDVLVLSTDSFSSIVDSEVGVPGRSNFYVKRHRLTVQFL